MAEEGPVVPPQVGVILVDHGSRLPAANEMLDDVVALFRETSGTPIAEPAHMVLAQPSIAQAFAKCVAQGAREVVVLPYFLSPGRHSTHDIPRMTAKAARRFPGVAYHVAEPLGVDRRMCAIIGRRVLDVLQGRGP